MYAEKHVNEEGARVYVKSRTGGLVRSRDREKENSGILSSFMVLFRSVFLPEGYPDSVSADYIYYQGWDTVQAFASSISGSLATAAVLEGVGVGDDTASPLAAALTWILRDGTGMVGRILFAARCGTRLDYDCKKWRLFADVLNDLAMLIEIITPRLGREFTLPVLCLASLSRSIVGVAGGATKAAVALHQARNHNMADLSAKDGSQETMVNLLALLVNLWLLPRIANYPGLVMPLFGLLTLLHVYANYRAVRSLEFSVLNCARLDLLLQEFSSSEKILSVRDANLKESLGFSLSSPRIRLGPSLTNLQDGQELEKLQGSVVLEKPFFLVHRQGQVLVFLAAGAKTSDILAGYISGWFLLRPEQSKEDPSRLLARLEKAGWSTERHALMTEGFTFQKSCESL